MPIELNPGQPPMQNLTAVENRSKSCPSHCGSQAATEGSRSRTQATICLVFIAPEVRATSPPP